MRTLTVSHRVTVHVRRQRATVRVDGEFVARLVKHRGRWTSPDGEHYDGPADAARDLADAA